MADKQQNREQDEKAAKKQAQDKPATLMDRFGHGKPPIPLEGPQATKAGSDAGTGEE